MGFATIGQAAMTIGFIAAGAFAAWVIADSLTRAWHYLEHQGDDA